MDEYEYHDAQACHTSDYLWTPVLRLLSAGCAAPGARILDLGCGNGTFTYELQKAGFDVVGIDTSVSGIRLAQQTWPNIDFRTMSAYDATPDVLGLFDVIVSLEVVEHLYSPKKYAQNICQLLRPGGTAVLSTPFHGYWKNLSLALTGKLDAHFTALWDHGHIKFWSVKTLTQLLSEAGLSQIRFEFAGRTYPFSKSMIAIAQRPATTIG